MAMSINKNVRNLLILGAVVLIVACLMIVPNFRALSRLSAETRTLRKAVAEQRQLLPVFRQMVRLAQGGDKTSLPLPPVTAVPRKDIGSAINRLTAAALDRHLVVTDEQAGLENFLQKTRRVRVQVMLSGDLDAFRRYLLAVAQIPFVEVIETVGVHAMPKPATRVTQAPAATAPAVPLSFELTLWIAVRPT